MAAVTLGFEEFAERLCVIRRRLNSLVVQHVLYSSAGLVLLALALLVVLAIHTAAPVFRMVFWAMLGAAVCSLPFGVLAMQRRWFSLHRAARLADSTAHLDDRLATLLAQRERAHPSRLRGVLLSQVLAMGPRWDVNAVAPRRISRSLYFLLAAMLVLAATSLLERPPSPMDHAAAARRPGAPGQENASVGRSPGKRDRNAPRILPGGSGAPGQTETGSSTLPAADAQRRGGGRSLGTGERDGKAQGLLGDGEPGQGSRGGSEAGTDIPAPPQAVTEKFQNLIRQAFRPQPPEHLPTQSRSDGQDIGLDGIQRPDPLPLLRADMRRQARREHARHGERDPQAPHHRQAPGDSTAEALQRQVPGGTRPAAGGKKAAGQLFAKGAGRGGAAATPSERLRLNLGASSASAPTRLEPQGGGRTDRTESNDTPEGVPMAPPGSDQQVSDAPLQKIDISPEHEATLRRIFTRGE